MEQQRARSADSIVMWILSVLLAAVFATTGIAKLIGADPLTFEAAAMHGFPGWIRTVVGVVELVGAIALLIPAVSGVAAALLAVLMIPATITQWISKQPGVLVPVVVLVLLLLVAWRRHPAAVRAGYDAARSPRPLVREGIIAGAIGATVIALWFFFVDLIAGHALFTPATLGRGMLSIFGPVPAVASTALLVAVYTVVHYAAFAVIGLIAAMIVSAANREPSILLGFVVLFAAIEVGFYAFVSLLEQATPLGSLAWYNVMIGNVLAAGAMGTYLLRVHPILREQFAHAIDGHRA
ncbi:MAG TPA: DoxX family protein [Gemmatimonadaceae bacterium]|nr:DoxX family protein [Gemmatimonadaceae bacterium]